jgi:hypothetical protein
MNRFKNTVKLAKYAEDMRLVPKGASVKLSVPRRNQPNDGIIRFVGDLNDDVMYEGTLKRYGKDLNRNLKYEYGPTGATYSLHTTTPSKYSSTSLLPGREMPPPRAMYDMLNGLGKNVKVGERLTDSSLSADSYHLMNSLNKRPNLRLGHEGSAELNPMGKRRRWPVSVAHDAEVTDNSLDAIENYLQKAYRKEGHLLREDSKRRGGFFIKRPYIEKLYRRGGILFSKR